MNRAATMEDAVHFVTAFSEKAKAAGYMLAVYGSVVTRQCGRDIDILAVPWRPADHRTLLNALVGAGCAESSGLYYGLMETCSVALLHRIGENSVLVDLQIREVKRPR